MTAYEVFCRNCEGRTLVHISNGAIGSVANCECGQSFLVTQDEGNLTPVEEAHP